jgi:hypothetical protein
MHYPIHALSEPFGVARSDVVVKLRLYVGIGRVWSSLPNGQAVSWRASCFTLSMCFDP